MKPLHAHEARTILVVTSVGDHLSVIPMATALARRIAARVLLVHVIPPNPAKKNFLPGVLSVADPIRRREIREELERVALQLQWQGIRCDSVVLNGEPAEEIAAIAHMKNASWAIVGASMVGAEGQQHGLSVMDRLIATLQIPVIVIGPRMIAYSEASVGNGKILLPVSLHHRRSEYIEFASQFARESCSRVALLHVLDTSRMTSKKRQQARDNARTQLAALAACEANPVHPMELLIREGNVSRAILDEAICPHRDWILLGAGAFAQDPSAHGGIVYQVIAEARCPVITLRCPAGDEIEAAESAGVADRESSLSLSKKSAA